MPIPQHTPPPASSLRWTRWTTAVADVGAPRVCGSRGWTAVEKTYRSEKKAPASVLALTVASAQRQHHR